MSPTLPQAPEPKAVHCIPAPGHWTHVSALPLYFGGYGRRARRETSGLRFFLVSMRFQEPLPSRDGNAIELAKGHEAA